MVRQNSVNQVLSIAQAARGSVTLAQLADLAEDSARRLQAITPLLPPALRSALKAGPIEGSSWCLLVSSNAVAAKLRQQIPALVAHLRSKGWEIATIRLKVSVGG
jgi:Dna[CI] antecedent, DciA